MSIERLKSLYFDQLERVAPRFAWIASLLTRISIGFVFLQAGWSKLHNLSGVSGFFAKVGIPAPGFFAPIVATTEFLCGLFLIAGFLTRLTALPLIFIMAIAVATAKAAGIGGPSDLFSLPEYLLALGLIWICFIGPGPLSVDTLFHPHPR